LQRSEDILRSLTTAERRYGGSSGPMRLAVRESGKERRQSASLRAGDWVEVRSAADILATLDDRGCVDNLPFMPEMLQYCGLRFRVLKSAHKTCDTIRSYRGRAMANAVHLDHLRCDGAAHGGCQARCLLFWNRAWLIPVEAPARGPIATPAIPDEVAPAIAGADALMHCARRVGGDSSVSDETVIYNCHATALLDATTPLDWRDPRSYLRDLTSRNIGLAAFIRYVAIAAFRSIVRRVLRDPDFPNRPGTGPAWARAEPLNLQPGDIVRVRSRDEIFQTLTAGRKTRGLWFDVEMEPFCGKICKVLARIDHIVDEKTGKMIKMSSDCIILEGGVCTGCLSRNRLFCPRHIYSYWREAWLERVS
jgi:hypothetical protein